MLGAEPLRHKSCAKAPQSCGDLRVEREGGKGGKEGGREAKDCCNTL